jgi:hypothetical protein
LAVKLSSSALATAHGGGSFSLCAHLGLTPSQPA